jgi:hypothetical protein
MLNTRTTIARNASPLKTSKEDPLIKDYKYDITIIRYTHRSFPCRFGSRTIKIDQMCRDIAAEVLKTRKIQAGIGFILSGEQVRKFIIFHPTEPEASANAFGFNEMSVSSTKRL